MTTRGRPIQRRRPAATIPTEHLADVVSDMQRQRHLDDQPCPDCGGDRLRADFTRSDRCHAPKETT